MSNLTDLVDAVQGATPALHRPPAEAPQQQFVPPQEQPLTSQLAREQVPGLVEGTHPTEHAELIDVVVKFALERGGVSTLPQLQEWLQRTLGNAQRAGDIQQEITSPWQKEVAVIEQLVNHLKAISGFRP